MRKPFITPGALYDNSSVEGIVIGLVRLARDIHECDLSTPENQAVLKERAAALLAQSRGTITGPIS